MIDPIKIEHFRNLVSLIAADGKIEEIEKITLSKIAYERGIPLDRFNVMLQHASEYVYLIPQNQKDKEKQMEEMIKIALIDGEFANAELDLIHLVGERLGFSSEQLHQIIEAHKGSAT